VRATGGLADTVTDYDSRNDAGTGFRFENYSGPDLIAAIRRSLDAYSDSRGWRQLIRRGMAEDWSWETSARRYLDLYQLIREKKQPEERPVFIRKR